MKYRVSLLPEYNRKRLEGKKKLERIKSLALVVLMVLALFLGVVVATQFYADNKLEEVRKLDNEYAQKVAELEQFREINANLQEKVQLIESIQVEEPQLVNFVAKISNLKCPGITIESLECTEWKTLRNCVLTGTCDNRDQYLNFEKTLSEMEGVSSVTCISYDASAVEGALVTFKINITCTGGGVVETTEAPTEAVTEATDDLAGMTE